MIGPNPEPTPFPHGNRRVPEHLMRLIRVWAQPHCAANFAASGRGREGGKGKKKASAVFFIFIF